MKNAFRILLIILLLTITITGCKRTVKYGFIQPTDEIIKIEIVIANKIDDIDRKDRPEIIHQFIVLKEFNDEKINMILSDFNNLNCHPIYTDPKCFPNDTLAIKVYYSSGNFELISKDAPARYLNGVYHTNGFYYFDDEQFEELIDKFLNEY